MEPLGCFVAEERQEEPFHELTPDCLSGPIRLTRDAASKAVGGSSFWHIVRLAQQSNGSSSTNVWQATGVSQDHLFQAPKSEVSQFTH